MSIAYISIGSNLGNKKENCMRAIKLLREKGVTVRKQSSMYETEPWGIRNQPSFINMAIEIETELKPRTLLDTLKDIEQKIGRKYSPKWGPRIIDLDILFFDNTIINEYNLKIPHPLINEREFVLRPLCEIAPNLIHPSLKMTVNDLLQQLNKKARLL